MGRIRFMMSLISGGKGKFVAETWTYEGSRKANGILVSDTTRFEELRRKISEKLAIDHDMFGLKLSYTAPLSANLPPFNLIDDNDLDAFKFLNMKYCNDGVWPIALYAILLVNGANNLFGDFF